MLVFAVMTSSIIYAQNDLQQLKEKIKSTISGQGMVAIAFRDISTGDELFINERERFHAASTIKVAVLLAVFRAADEGRFQLDDSLHVRNRFFSAADGSPLRLSQDRDAMPELYSAIGRTAKLSSLALGMICRSSNLATNLLLEFVGVEYARTVLREAQVEGVELRRGV